MSSKAKRLPCKEKGKSMTFDETPDDDCIRCTVFLRWAHDQCARINEEDD